MSFRLHPSLSRDEPSAPENITRDISRDSSSDPRQSARFPVDSGSNPGLALDLRKIAIFGRIQQG